MQWLETLNDITLGNITHIKITGIKKHVWDTQKTVNT